MIQKDYFQVLTENVVVVEIKAIVVEIVVEVEIVEVKAIVVMKVVVEVVVEMFD